MADDNIFDVGDEGEETLVETPQETQAAPETSSPQPEAASTGGSEAGSEDDLFSFLDNDAGPDPVEPLDQEQEAVEEESPEPPAATVASPMDRVAEQMAAFLERQNTPPPVPAAVAPVWVDPYERPENVTRLAELEEQALFSVEAARELRQLERKFDREASGHLLEETLGQERARLTGINALQSTRDTAFASLKASAPYVERSFYDAAETKFVQDVFGGDTSAYAAIASNPQIREQIANNAELAAIKARSRSQAKPTAKPPPSARPSATGTAKPVAPANVSITPGRTYTSIEDRLANDSNYNDDVSARAFGIGKKKERNY